MTTIQIERCPVCKGKAFSPYLTCKDFSVSQERFELHICNNCHFIFTQSHPDQKSIGPYYQSEDYVSHTDTQKGLVFKLYHIARNYMLEQKRKLVEQFSSEKYKRILDIGCGTGYFLNHMKQHNWNTVGIEQDENAREFAESRFNLEVFPPEGITSFAENSFNTITLWHVLEHIHNLNAIMESIRHILTPDGTLVIALPNPDSYDAEKYKEFWAAYDVPRHLWHFKPDVIVRLCEQHGFSLITKRRMPLDGFYVSILTEKYKGKRFLSLPFGILTGMFSMLAGWFNINKTSSLIYVFKKTN